MKVYLTAIVHANNGVSETLKSVLQDMVIHSQKEEACLQYDLFQSTENSETFIFNEIWVNQTGLDLHNEMPYIKDFNEKYGNLVNSIKIFKTSKIS
ncbi:putative quinol monooxygenase [Pedobacter sp.]|uniref:putative quinol monooxygenase n=1 Tax=Pedobacter sp. TaxID=1411316 RepID=UPI003BA85539